MRFIIGEKGFRKDHVSYSKTKKRDHNKMHDSFFSCSNLDVCEK